MTLLDLDPSTRIERLVVHRAASRWFGGLLSSGDSVRWDGHGHDAARVADLRSSGRARTQCPADSDSEADQSSQAK